MVDKAMRQFTTPDQTAKLIELGFEMPKTITSISWDTPCDDSPFINANSVEFEWHYSIGELIGLLPRYCWYKYGDKAFRAQIQIKFYLSRWHIVYRKFEEEHCGHLYDCGSDELVDALYNMIVKLKEERVI